MVNFSGIKIKVAGRQPAYFIFQLYFSVHASTLVALFSADCFILWAFTLFFKILYIRFLFFVFPESLGYWLCL